MKELGNATSYLTWISLSLAPNYVIDGLFVLNDVLNVFNALAVIAGPRMVISLRALENKARGEGGTFEGELSTIQFGIGEPPTQSEPTMEEGALFGTTLCLSAEVDTLKIQHLHIDLAEVTGIAMIRLASE
ncbi:hypothetical protein BJ138DRAFT_1103257 [Hygrophoropsis aurantiaca]|uniref:Uncharacterized protein n=1 Tax=Hygrophoropsis aurantiaca TaxID=72124 RepID=A0ACB8A5I5_9AGAM|nr:hypothetical protein BJ138DRAFT_1103257 [Hygrophoropsis aurantiaca]